MDIKKETDSIIHRASLVTLYVTAKIVRDHIDDPEGSRHNLLKCISLYLKEYY